MSDPEGGEASADLRDEVFLGDVEDTQVEVVIPGDEAAVADSAQAGAARCP